LLKVTALYPLLSDSHDAVLRFNAAPTSGYEKDVGSKTTIRLINSQVTALQIWIFGVFDDSTGQDNMKKHIRF
jgi:hypothetical protein